ncbi:MAG: hypothetical protein JO222_01770 [Frankiales bacterium]|nr:hypothetical protein [Frankiales bacterium]
MTTERATLDAHRRDASAAAILLLVAAAVAVALGVYASAHHPAGRPLFTFGFSGMLQLKTWFATAAVALLVVQLVTALWMWGRLPRARRTPAAVAWVHRWSGSIAFVLTLPPAFHCLWALGFGTGSTRVLLHGLAGCAFYGAYAAKMLGLRMRGLPDRAVPVLGGAVLTLLVAVWLTSALWFFSRSGLPLT